MPSIRPEQPRDFDAVRALLLTAFGREAEARLVDRLRASGKIASALVAEENDRILGHAIFSRIAVHGDAAQVDAIALAPLAVIPAFQRLGIGSALVDECNRLASEAQRAAVVLQTQPAMTAAHRIYLSRGYVPAPSRDFTRPDGVVMSLYRLALR